jgi:hypothetical protein
VINKREENKQNGKQRDNNEEKGGLLMKPGFWNTNGRKFPRGTLDTANIRTFPDISAINFATTSGRTRPWGLLGL